MDMLTSELAEELSVDPSVITKMRNTYREEARLESAPALKGEVLNVLREAHALKLESKNMTYRQAIRHKLGLATEPITAEQVGVLEKRLATLEQAAVQQDEKLDQILDRIDWLIKQLQPNGEQETDVEPNDAPPVTQSIDLTSAAAQEDATQLHSWAEELVPSGALDGTGELGESENS